MKLALLTLALDAMPFLPQQLETFEALPLDWVWLIAEGAAANTHCTSWCRPQEPRLSRDGTSEWINDHLRHPRIKAFRKQLWDGKVSMCNAALAALREPAVLVQIDADEFHTPEQLTKIHELLSTDYVKAYFSCRYFVSPDIVVLPENDPVNNIWLRAWRFTPGDKFQAHEPPMLSQAADATGMGPILSHVHTQKIDLVFNHYSYFYESQVAFKEKFYGYPDAVKHWRRLQENTEWPAKLTDFFPWAKPGAIATKL